MDKKTIVWKLICGLVIIAVAVLLLTGVLNGHEVRYHTQALTREELTELLRQSGCREAAWKFPEETGFYQPIVVARK